MLLNFQAGQAHVWKPEEGKNLTQITTTISWKVEPELIKYTHNLFKFHRNSNKLMSKSDMPGHEIKINKRVIPYILNSI